MRRDHDKEEKSVYVTGSGRSTEAICGVCGTILEKDQESGEYRCPVCDVVDE